MGKRKGGDVLDETTLTTSISVATSSDDGTVVSRTTDDCGSKTLVRQQVASPTSGGFSINGNAHTIRAQSGAPAWLDSASFDHKLRVVRESLKLEDSDDFLVQLHQYRNTVSETRQKHAGMGSSSGGIQDDLTDQISAEEEQCQVESQTTLNMEEDLQQMLKERDGNLAVLSEMEQLQGELQNSVGSAVKEVDQQVQSINLLEDTRKNQVPRLKHHISMYATTTGIKWDYYDGDGLEHQNILEGHVVSTRVGEVLGIAFLYG